MPPCWFLSHRKFIEDRVEWKTDKRASLRTSRFTVIPRDGSKVGRNLPAMPQEEPRIRQVLVCDAIMKLHLRRRFENYSETGNK